MKTMIRIRGKRIVLAATGLLILYAVLLVPEPSPAPPDPAGQRPFKWNQNERWTRLEQEFNDALALGCEGLRDRVDTRLRAGNRLLASIDSGRVDFNATILDTVEENIFRLGPLVAACRERLPEYIELVTRTRSAIKRQSEHWDLAAGKDRLYRILWGGRTALEEVMLQGSSDSIPALIPGDDEPSATPFTRILGVTIHSGDILVSRGGAPTSALIAVGSDYPGNFSHVAIVYVDEETSLPTVIQSSEEGVHPSPLDEYLDEVKLRVMVLRPRCSLPELVADPLLPHRAAELALHRAESGHTPYDFAIDHTEDHRMYCSEVPAWAYRQTGIDLWMNLSRVSSPGTRTWLTDLGVRRFDLKEPSDLEYDPQLRVVAEWRDPETLYLDHVDNVITEALLEKASPDHRLTHEWYLLPFLRVAKGYSVMLNVFGLAGPVPEGLSATVAARVLKYNRRHNAIKERVLELAEEFRVDRGYRPPEWQLLRLAQEARDELR